MILPVYLLGTPVLKKKAENIDKDYPKLQEIISNMFDTMKKADGVGLAAPQIGLSIRIFVIDAEPFGEDDPELKTFRKAFINAQIVEETGDEWYYNEGCLSVPGIREDIKRKPKIHIKYYDENFEFHDEWHDGIKARIIQHEYDHLEATLLVDRLSPLKRKLLKRKINDIMEGNVDVNYKFVASVKK